MCPGEGVPVMKTALPPGGGQYNPEAQRRHTLYCGTQLIQAKGAGPGGGGVIAVVTNTGKVSYLGGLYLDYLYCI